MCGACGSPGPDWSLPFVSGLRRRTTIAALLTAVCKGVTIRAANRAWTVRTPTGGWAVAGSLDELVTAIAHRMVCSDWNHLQGAVRDHSSGPGSSSCDSPYPSGTRCFRDDRSRLTQLDAIADPVLTEPADLHLRVVGFAAAVRHFEQQTVALELTGTGSGPRLIATDRRVIGLVQ